ncbi:MAG: steroid 3-ketoacyl-CoA thiolase, partial [Acidimicrobiales bacterium]
LKASWIDGGVITAGNSSQISDGASAVMVMSEGRAGSLGARPLARLVSFATAACDPLLAQAATIPATTLALKRAGLGVDEIDLFEVDESFASAVLAWSLELGPQMDRVNVNGGAIALGDPVGASGTRLLTTLVHELARRKLRYGLVTIAGALGTANACVVESLG